MTDRTGSWTRRQFSQALAASAAASLLTRSAHAAPARGFAFIGSGGANDGRLHVFRLHGLHWSAVQSLESAAPAHIVMHPSLPVLYAVHSVDRWQNLPRGAVSAYALNRESGELKPMGTQPLSLSATQPRHAAVMPGGTSLVVAAQTGGIYNVLPLDRGGNLLPVAGIRKEFGRADGDEGKAASPRFVTLHPDGSVFTADAGQETISRFALRETGLDVLHRTRVHPGSGPSQLLVLPDGSSACTICSESGSVALHRLTPDGLSDAVSTTAGDGPGEMALHPSGRFLVVAGARRTAILRTGSQLAVVAESGFGGGMHSMRFTPDGATLVSLQGKAVVVQPFDAGSGTLAAPYRVAEVKAATSLLLQTA